MPLVKNTESGNNYLEKTNTGGDACGRTAIRSYEKQVGSDGATNTVFALPWYYIPDSHTMWIYVNGQKGEYMALSGDTTEQQLHYAETGNQEVTFYYALEDTDVIEFIIAGNYSGDAEGILAPDLTPYKTKDDTNNFTATQNMGGYKLQQLAAGTTNGDSVRFEQLGTQVLSGGTHYHSYLFDNGMVNPVISTYNTGIVSVDGIIDMNSSKITELATCTVATDGANKAYVDDTEITYIALAGTNCNVTGQILREHTNSVSTYIGLIRVGDSTLVATFDFPFSCSHILDIQLTQYFDGISLPTYSNSAAKLTLVGSTVTASIASEVNNAYFNFVAHIVKV